MSLINSIIQEHYCKILFLIWHLNHILIAKVALKHHNFAIRKRDVLWTSTYNEVICIFNPLVDYRFLMHGFIMLSDVPSYEKDIFLYTKLGI